MSISYAVFCLKKKTPVSAARTAALRRGAAAGVAGYLLGFALASALAAVPGAAVALVLARSANNAERATHFFFNHTPTTEIYTLSLHDALPISRASLNSRCLPIGW